MLPAMAQGGRRREVPDGGKTMQLDAVVDELEEIAAPDLGGSTKPPPLPPKKASKGALIAGVVIVLLAAALGVGAGAILLGEPEAPAGPTPPVAREGAAPSEPAAADAPTDEAEAPGDEGDVVQIDEVVFGAQDEAP